MEETISTVETGATIEMRDENRIDPFEDDLGINEMKDDEVEIPIASDEQEKDYDRIFSITLFSFGFLTCFPWCVNIAKYTNSENPESKKYAKYSNIALIFYGSILLAFILFYFGVAVYSIIVAQPNAGDNTN